MKLLSVSGVWRFPILGAVLIAALLGQGVAAQSDPEPGAPDDRRIIGDKGAEHFLIAYLSPSCTFCMEFFNNELKSLESGGVFSEGRIETGDLQVEIVMTPRNNSDVKIVAGLTCLPTLESFRAGLERVFAQHERLWADDYNDADAADILADAGVQDPETCMNDPTRLAEAVHRRQVLEHRAAVEGFPVFESGGRFLEGVTSLETLNALIDGS